MPRRHLTIHPVVVMLVSVLAVRWLLELVVPGLPNWALIVLAGSAGVAIGAAVERRQRRRSRATPSPSK